MQLGRQPLRETPTRCRSPCRADKWIAVDGQTKRPDADLWRSRAARLPLIVNRWPLAWPEAQASTTSLGLP
jgi:hypothetical protein